MLNWFKKREAAPAGAAVEFPYPCEVVAGALALDRLNALRAVGAGTPIILGGQEEFERAREWMDLTQATVEGSLAVADTLDPVAWLEERASEEPGQFDVEPSDWPENAPTNESLSAHLDIRTRLPLDKVYITVLPDAQAWKAACFLKIGGWNAMPDASEHSALWRHWEQQYGATVACIANDVIEFTVARPPQTRDEALALARQQFVYCEDIVHQGVGSVEALAATILKASVWYFWWD